MFEDHIKKVVVIGAAGKMGSGISLLCCRLGCSELVLVDSAQERLDGLRGYLEAQLEDSSVLDTAEFTTELSSAQGATLVFEAIVEEIDVKVAVFKQLKTLVSPGCFFMSNTSSIPISILDEKADLGGHLLGFHFYNPPAVQKLVELIWSENTDRGLRKVAEELGRKMGKVIVPSRDVAGFIGNGHFMRDILFASHQVMKLANTRPTSDCIYMVNRISRDWLLRPMGIFQLMDYVGVDVCLKIFSVMNEYIAEESFGSPLLDIFEADGKLGGQHPDGSQKDGILRYEQGKPTAVWDSDEKSYRPFDKAWTEALDSELGEVPMGLSWRALRKDSEKDDKLAAYFEALQTAEGLGAELARAYLERSRQIADDLVASGVAEKLADVDEVLVRGFAHLYGPSLHSIFGAQSKSS